jgi:competence protein ComEC
LWNTGFQLSTIGTLGIVVITPLFQRLFRPIDRLPYAHVITEATSVTLAAQIATLPIFAATFNQVSFIAPLANLLTVPLLNTLILIGTVLCVAGAIALPLGMLCGWIIWPLLKYTILAVSWCASIPDAFLIVSNNWDTRLAWCYYGALTLALGFALPRWPEKRQAHDGKFALSLLTPNTQTNQVVIENKPQEVKAAPSGPPPRIVPVLRYAAAVIMILATGAAIAAAPPNEHLSIILLNVGPAGMPAQGEGILIHTIDGKTILIDGGLDATSLSQELDSRLPFWQRSIDTVILTTPRQDHLTGSLDVLSRFQVGEVLDAGMVHPDAGYTLWRRTIDDRKLSYAQVRGGSSIPLGTQVTLQVLWPPSTLHPGTDEGLNNALIARLVTLRMV